MCCLCLICISINVVSMVMLHTHCMTRSRYLGAIFTLNGEACFLQRVDWLARLAVHLLYAPIFGVLNVS